MSPSTRDEWDKRLLYFDWPRGCPRITFNIGSKKLKRWSMTQYKLIALVAPSLFNNLISSTDMEIFLDMVQIVEFYTSPSLSEQHIQDMKSSISGFFSKIINRFPTEHGTTSTYKIANLHYITEYIVRDVEIFGHRLGECLTEEHAHQKVLQYFSHPFH